MNTVYLLPAQPPDQPDTLVVYNSFAGAGAPHAAPVPYAESSSLIPGAYAEVDLASSPNPVTVVTLVDPAAPGDRIALKVTSLSSGGTTVTAPGLSRQLSTSDSIIVFEYVGSAWVEV